MKGEIRHGSAHDARMSRPGAGDIGCNGRERRTRSGPRGERIERPRPRIAWPLGRGRLRRYFCESAGHAETLDLGLAAKTPLSADRKSTRLNSSHLVISYAVFCLKKKINPMLAEIQRHNDLRR